VVVVMEESWRIAAAPATSLRRHLRWGEHGWDPSLPSMHAIFVISGPGIRRGGTIDSVGNVDVYLLMAGLLRLTPAAGLDGRPGLIQQVVDMAAVRE
jgi:hypothetical protein